MAVTSLRNTLGALIFVASLVQGCTTTSSENTRTDAGEVALPVASKSVVGNRYVAFSNDQIVRTSQSECVRTVNWDSADSTNACADAVVAQPEPATGPGSALVSYNGRALFDFDSATLTGAGQQQLDQLTAKLNAQDEIEAIEIVGHADSIGSDAYNQTLSENRAEAVKAYLQRSLRSVGVSAKGLGEAAPIADNSTEAGRQLNRRVDVNIAAVTVKK